MELLGDNDPELIKEFSFINDDIINNYLLVKILIDYEVINNEYNNNSWECKRKRKDKIVQMLKIKLYHSSVLYTICTCIY